MPDTYMYQKKLIFLSNFINENMSINYYTEPNILEGQLSQKKNEID